MHIRRLAAFLLGAWLTGSVFMAVVATHNLTAVDRLMAAPPTFAALRIETMGQTAARTFLRFQASELNRWYFETWEWAQLGLGVLLLLALIAGRIRRRSVLVLCGLMLLAVVAMHFALEPQLARLGRLIDFLPANRPSADRNRFWNYHAAYAATEVLKGFLGLFLLSSLLRQHGTRSEEGGQRKKWVRAS